DIWLVLPGRDAWAVRQRDAFLEGYEQFRAFDRSTLRLIEPLRALRMIHYATWIARRWH
ncbi:MAG TPA: serine/threonine protein kinase, partial [Acidobacteria bacterium]|nr:serine/threonine protein kinase [Acidobacteriota bacterium]